MPAQIFLVNNTKKTLIINARMLQDNPLIVRAISGIGKSYRGSLRSQLNKDGDTAPQKGRVLKRLGLGDAISIKIDLINILGKLPNGKYKAQAFYWPGGNNNSNSNIVEFQINDTQIATSTTYQDHFRNDTIPIRTAWINREADGNYLFLMQNSQKNPMHITSNIRICKTEKECYPSPALLASFGQSIEHVLLIGSGSLAIVEISRGKGRIAWEEPFKKTVLHPAITTEGGELRFVSYSSETEAITLHLSIFVNGRMETRQVIKIDEPPRSYSICYDEECNLHMAYVVRKTIEYLKVQFNADEERAIEIKKSINVKSPIFSLRMINALAGDDEKTRMNLIYSYKENDELITSIVGVPEGVRISNNYIQLEKRKIKLVQMLIDQELKPHFLFTDHEGRLLFRPHAGSFSTVLAEDGKDLGSKFSPLMLITSKYARKKSIYLRHTHRRFAFTYMPLKSL